jgi:hypothetical protein
MLALLVIKNTLSKKEDLGSSVGGFSTKIYPLADSLGHSIKFLL